MLKVFSGALAISLVGTCAGAQVRSLDTVDLFVERNELVDQIVQVSGGYLKFASTLNILYGPATGTNVSVDPLSLDKETLRAALRECPGNELKGACAGDIVGTVAIQGEGVVLRRATFIPRAK